MCKLVCRLVGIFTGLLIANAVAGHPFDSFFMTALAVPLAFWFAFAIKPLDE
ncbi:hypothetical protein EVC03_022 [Rhizobium phage RHph_Y5A]|nr:hypothetical protein EVC03_022 [Rhizobium phage RHph_Y5A]QIG75464.1 hypothetical protein EVC18_022 [Rhizobium phage RHph_Y2_4]